MVLAATDGSAALMPRRHLPAAHALAIDGLLTRAALSGASLNPYLGDRVHRSGAALRVAPSPYVLGRRASDDAQLVAAARAHAGDGLVVTGLLACRLLGLPDVPGRPSGGRPGPGGAPKGEHALRARARDDPSSAVLDGADQRLPASLLNPTLLVGGVTVGRPDGWFVGRGSEVDSRQFHAADDRWDATLARHDAFAGHGLQRYGDVLAAAVEARAAAAQPEPAGLLARRSTRGRTSCATSAALRP